MKTIKKNGITLAKHIFPEDIHEGLNFFSDDGDYIQVGAWQYNENKELLAHVHNEFDRNVTRTCETLYIIQGSVHVKIYTDEQEMVDEFDAKGGEIVILLSGGHGYKIMRDNTKVLEVKNGPYFGAELDRRRFIEQ